MGMTRADQPDSVEYQGDTDDTLTESRLIKDSQQRDDSATRQLHRKRLLKMIIDNEERRRELKLSVSPSGSSPESRAAFPGGLPGGGGTMRG